MNARSAIALGLALVALTGCGGGEDGASSPEDAVSRFLAALSKAPQTKGSGEASPELEAYWRELCDVIDPEVRAALKFDDQKNGDASRTECGGTVAFAVGYTGDTGRMAAPSSIEGEPTAAATDGDSSIVTVAMRYASQPSPSAPPPPPTADVKVLAIERSGSWWVATPQAFNPLNAVDPASESELRAQHRKLLGRADVP